MRYANVQGTKLSHANLCGADTRGTNLLQAADWMGATEARVVGEDLSENEQEAMLSRMGSGKQARIELLAYSFVNPAE